MTEDETKDVQLEGRQCHFDWDLEQLMIFSSAEDVSSFLNDRRHDNNEVVEKTFSASMKRARRNLMISYAMFNLRHDGWEKALENAFRLLKFSLDGSGPEPLLFLPEFSSPLWKGSPSDFFAYIPEDEESFNNQDLESEDDTDIEGDKIGEVTAVEHVALVLKAEMFKRSGSSAEEVEEILEKALPTERMSHQQRAELLFVKAEALRMCGTGGLPRAINILRAAVLIDPDNLRWTLHLVRFTGYQHRSKWSITTGKEWYDFTDTMEKIDAILRLDSLEPNMRERFQFQKLLLIQEYWHTSKNFIEEPEKSRLLSTCTELCEAVVQTSGSPRTIAYCAKVFTYYYGTRLRAIQLIEKALQQLPTDIYINGKASAIYRRTGDFEKALECAEVGSRRGLGSSLQVLELKLILGHQFDVELFFEEARKRHRESGDAQKLYRTAFLYYLYLTGDDSRGMAHFKKAFQLNPLAECLGHVYCHFANIEIHVAEVAYCLALSKAPGKCFEEVQKAIEGEYDVQSFQSLKHSTPEEVIAKCKSDGEEWLASHQKTWASRIRPDEPYRPNLEHNPRPQPNWRTEPRGVHWPGNSFNTSKGSWRNSSADFSVFDHWASCSSHMHKMRKKPNNQNLTNWRERSGRSDGV